MTTFTIIWIRTDGRAETTVVDGYEAESVMLHLRGKYTVDKKTQAIHIFQDGQHYSSWEAPAKEDPPWPQAKEDPPRTPSSPHPQGTFDAFAQGLSSGGKVRCKTQYGDVFADPFNCEVGDAIRVEVTHRRAGGVLFVDAKAVL